MYRITSPIKGNNIIITNGILLRRKYDCGGEFGKIKSDHIKI